MVEIKIQTKNQVDIDRKRRVWFTCHPHDFEKYFQKICDDLFKTHDCAIYYTADPNAPMAEEDRDTDLGRNNLFVVPVTFSLLTEPNRAMDADIPYALERHIPVLPIMMEPGLDSLYALPNKFGELQYLSPFSTDRTEISYEEKLKKFLDTVLISDETAKRIRAAFDAYIFLSYRKKDRRHANALMRLIHSHPEYRDIAIWFDEFLTPGESFRDNIEKILSSSKLFALLVTPNLLEEPDGKPNFVMAEEYPAACKAEIPILPAEMVETDHTALQQKYRGIPTCIDPRNKDFRDFLLNSLVGLATQSNNTPEHDFLIGMAYLEGIDVEVDRQRGVELITAAAETGQPEAIFMLFNMYSNGAYVPQDYCKALEWIQKYTAIMVERHGEEHPVSLAALNNLAFTYGLLGNHAKALELHQKLYTIQCQVLGTEHPDTLISFLNIASSYSGANQDEKALELLKDAHGLLCRVLGEEHIATLTALSNLAHAYSDIQQYGTACELFLQAYHHFCRVLSPEDPHTINVLHDLAYAHLLNGETEKAIELQTNAYEICCSKWGSDHPCTLKAISDLGLTYIGARKKRKGLALLKKVYTIRSKTLGKTHPETLNALSTLAEIYRELDDHEKCLELSETLYELRCKTLGKEHPDTLDTLLELSYAHNRMGNHTQALALQEQAFASRCALFGEEDEDTVFILVDMARSYGRMGNHGKALELFEKVYILRCKTLGESHPNAIHCLLNVGRAYSMLENNTKALEQYEKGYALCMEFLGEEHPHTIEFLLRIASLQDLRSALPLYQDALRITKKVYGPEHPKAANLAQTILYISLSVGE